MTTFGLSEHVLLSEGTCKLAALQEAVYVEVGRMARAQCAVVSFPEFLSIGDESAACNLTALGCAMPSTDHMIVI